MHRRNFLSQLASGAALAGLAFSTSGKLRATPLNEDKAGVASGGGDSIRITRVRAYLTAPSRTRLVVPKSCTDVDPPRAESHL